MDAVQAMWDEFAAATGVVDDHTVEAFAEGDPTLSTELGLLVRDGPKRATASVVAAYETEGEPLPRLGTYTVVIDGAGLPLCIIRTTELAIRRFGEVDERFAFDEGEGDRTLSFWRQAHREFFATHGGITLDDDTEMVLERFQLVWPR
jgi:uncharacterized protein YhfF